ncbi:MAG: phage major capsid protein [Oscillospiraceae bacterium]|nr:phage major capsid protein [Oscillospiraceae bacterium]
MLKALMLRKKLDDKKKILEELQKTAENLQIRETELEQSIAEVQTEEERTAVENAVDAFETEKRNHELQTTTLKKEIADLEQDLADLETKQRSANLERKQPEVRESYMTTTANKAFFGMNMQEREAFFRNQEVRDMLQHVRTCIREKRSISGASLTIPEVMLGLIRQNILAYSKLLKYLNRVHVPGKARQNIMGSIPEAVWTEACGKLNELNLKFNNVEVDGYKVGGYFAMCNSILEDSDINLATELIQALSKSIAYALDKAVLYGTGKKMPLGIVARLAQASEPDTYPETARTWKNLSATHLIAIDSTTTGLKLYQELVLATGVLNTDYSSGAMFWAMNPKTYTKLIANAMSINSAGAIVSGQTATMPVIGGAIEKLNFIPDDVIIGGYGDLYLLAERSGVKLAQSEHTRFIEDQTVFKGTARYDGIPVIPEAFIAVSIGGTAPTATMTFATDTANANA